MQSEKVKLSIGLVVDLLNQGKTVFEVARLTGNHEYSVRYLLRKHGCKRVVRWECDVPARTATPSGEAGAS